jgi:hypothetical protein
MVVRLDVLLMVILVEGTSVMEFRGKLQIFLGISSFDSNAGVLGARF